MTDETPTEYFARIERERVERDAEARAFEAEVTAEVVKVKTEAKARGERVTHSAAFRRAYDAVMMRRAARA